MGYPPGQRRSQLSARFVGERNEVLSLGMCRSGRLGVRGAVLNDATCIAQRAIDPRFSLQERGYERGCDC